MAKQSISMQRNESNFYCFCFPFFFFVFFLAFLFICNCIFSFALRQQSVLRKNGSKYFACTCCHSQCAWEYCNNNNNNNKYGSSGNIRHDDGNCQQLFVYGNHCVRAARWPFVPQPGQRIEQVTQQAGSLILLPAACCLLLAACCLLLAAWQSLLIKLNWVAALLLHKSHFSGRFSRFFVFFVFSLGIRTVGNKVPSA